MCRGVGWGGGQRQHTTFHVCNWRQAVYGTGWVERGAGQYHMRACGTGATTCMLPRYRAPEHAQAEPGPGALALTGMHAHWSDSKGMLHALTLLPRPRPRAADLQQPPAGGLGRSHRPAAGAARDDGSAAGPAAVIVCPRQQHGVRRAPAYPASRCRIPSFCFLGGRRSQCGGASPAVSAHAQHADRPPPLPTILIEPPSLPMPCRGRRARMDQYQRLRGAGGSPSKAPSLPTGSVLDRLQRLERRADLLTESGAKAEVRCAAQFNCMAHTRLCLGTYWCVWRA